MITALPSSSMGCWKFVINAKETSTEMTVLCILEQQEPRDSLALLVTSKKEFTTCLTSLGGSTTEGENSTSSDSVNLNLIIGMVSGGVVLIVIIAATIGFIRLRRRDRGETELPLSSRRIIIDKSDIVIGEMIGKGFELIEIELISF